MTKDSINIEDELIPLLEEMKSLYNKAKKESDHDRFSDTEVGFFGKEGIFKCQFRDVYQGNVGPDIRSIKSNQNLDQWFEIKLIEDFLQNETFILQQEFMTFNKTSKYSEPQLQICKEVIKRTATKFNEKVSKAIKEQSWGQNNNVSRDIALPSSPSLERSPRRGSVSSLGLERPILKPVDEVKKGQEEVDEELNKILIASGLFYDPAKEASLESVSYTNVPLSPTSGAGSEAKIDAATREAIDFFKARKDGLGHLEYLDLATPRTRLDANSTGDYSELDNAKPKGNRRGSFSSLSPEKDDDVKPSLLGGGSRRSSLASYDGSSQESILLTKDTSRRNSLALSETSEDGMKKHNNYKQEDTGQGDQDQQEKKKRDYSEMIDNMSSAVLNNSGKYMTALVAFIVSPTLGLALLIKSIVSDINESNQQRGGDEAKISGGYELVDSILSKLQGDEFNDLKKQMVEHAKNPEYKGKESRVSELTAENLTKHIREAQEFIRRGSIASRLDDAASEASHGMGSVKSDDRKKQPDSVPKDNGGGRGGGRVL